MITRARPRDRTVKRPRRRVAPRARAPEPRVDLEALGAAWRSALDAAEAALRAASSSLTEQELLRLNSRLRDERASTVRLLEDVARAERVDTRFLHVLVARKSCDLAPVRLPVRTSL